MSEANASVAPSGRHYGLDWLRIAAFALLILYHIALVFSPWHWVIHTSYALPELIAPMALLTPWRLALLFAVSGYASRFLFEKSGSAPAFLRARNLRLLIPLAFGMAVLIPPEMWIRVHEAGYPHGYLHFWAIDYWRWGEFYGRLFPSWEHLWFVAYLWTYTALLALILWRARDQFDRLADRTVAWVSQGWRLLWAPAAALVLVKLALLFVVEEEQGILRDWAGHVHYFPLFLFGFVLGGAPALWPALRRVAWPAALLSVLTGTVIVIVEAAYPGNAIPPHGVMAGTRAAQVTMSWTMTVLLIHLADRTWNRDHRWRQTIAEAVFPFYLVHQPAIVLIAWASLPFGLSAGAEFILLVTGTGAVCLATYLVGRRIGWLRPLIGLGPRRALPAPRISPQPA